MTSGNEDVLVLTDSDGNYYTITRELLQLAKVGSEEHKARIRELTSGQDTSGFGGSAGSGLYFLGSFQSSQNLYIRPGYFSPAVSNIRNLPAPPS